MARGALPAVRPLGFVIPLAALVGCASGFFAEREAGYEERIAFEEAANHAENSPALARTVLNRFLFQWPKGSLSDDAVFMLGEIARREGDLNTALRYYRQVVDEYGYSNSVDLSRLRIAQIDFEWDDLPAARAVLADIRLEGLPRDALPTAYRLLADTAEGPGERLLQLAAMRSVVPPSQIPGLDVEIDDLLVELDREALERAASRTDSRPPTARILLVVADRALQNGDPEAAAAALERAAQLPLSPAYRSLMISVRGRLRAREGGGLQAARLPSFADLTSSPPPSVEAAKGSIGVVLPLSGPFARFGESSLHGALLAAGVFGDEAGAPRLRLRVYDSGGEAERAAKAVRDLAGEEDVVAVVGPMRSAACEAAAGVAQEAGLPLLALTAREEVASDRDYAFRLSTTPEEDVDLLVQRARATGAERFAILYRNDAYGLAMRALFWDAVERASGEIVGVASYDPQATDFADSIRSLVGYELLERSERAQLGERGEMLRRARRVPAEEALVLEEQAAQLTRADGWPLPPLVDFDAIFIPDSYQNLVLIAPQLAFHEAAGARILAPDGAYHEELLRLAREHLRGALFSAHFFPDSPISWVSAFAREYEATFGEPPNAFAAEAYDAVRVVALQLAEGRTRRSELRDGLKSLAPYPGVSGVIGIDEWGHVRKRPFLLGVQRRRAVQLTD